MQGEWFTDTLDGPMTRKEGNRYRQVFANPGYFAMIYLMDTKSKVGDEFQTFCIGFCVPEKFTCDSLKEQTGKKT